MRVIVKNEIITIQSLFWDFCSVLFFLREGKIYVCYSFTTTTERWVLRDFKLERFIRVLFQSARKMRVEFWSWRKMYRKRERGARKKRILSEISLDSSTQLKGNSSSFEVTMSSFLEDLKIWKFYFYVYWKFIFTAARFTQQKNEEARICQKSIKLIVSGVWDRF